MILLRTSAAAAQLIDQELLLDMHSSAIVDYWDALGEFAAIIRERAGSALYENFEYVTVLAQDWIAQHPSGTYPANVRRIDLPNKWRSADLEYTVSLAT